MSAAELLADLNSRGIELKAEGDRLVYDASHGVILPADIEQLHTHKTNLLKELTHEHHTTRVTQDIEPARDTADARRPQPAIRQYARFNDRRATPSAADVQGGATGDFETVEPTAPCPDCGTGQWWHCANEPWRCRQCVPLSGATATTLTLPCHVPAARPCTRSRAA